MILLLVLVSVAATGFALRGFISRNRASSQVAADVQVWEKRVSDAPTDTQARLELGQAYTRAERYQDAMDQFDRVLQTNPQDIGALYGRGVALQQLGEEKKAEAAFWEVLKIDDGHVGSATELGRMYAARGHYRSLIEAVRPASQRYPSAAELQYLMGLAYENLGRTDWAKARYELALKASPDMNEAREALDRLEGSR